MIADFGLELNKGINRGAAQTLGWAFRDLIEDAAQDAHLKVLKHVAKGGRIDKPFAFGWQAGVWAALSQIDQERPHRSHRCRVQTPSSPTGDELDARPLTFSDGGMTAKKMEGSVTVREILSGIRTKLTKRQWHVLSFVLLGHKQTWIAKQLGVSTPLVCKEVSLIKAVFEYVLSLDDDDHQGPSGNPRRRNHRGRRGAPAIAVDHKGDTMNGTTGNTTLLDTPIPKSLVRQFFQFALQLPAFAELEVTASKMAGPKDIRDLLVQLDLVPAHDFVRLILVHPPAACSNDDSSTLAEGREGIAAMHHDGLYPAAFGPRLRVVHEADRPSWELLRALPPSRLQISPTNRAGAPHFTLIGCGGTGRSVLINTGLERAAGQRSLTISTGVLHFDLIDYGTEPICDERVGGEPLHLLHWNGHGALANPPVTLACAEDVIRVASLEAGGGGAGCSALTILAACQTRASGSVARSLFSQLGDLWMGGDAHLAPCWYAAMARPPARASLLASASEALAYVIDASGSIGYNESDLDFSIYHVREAMCVGMQLLVNRVREESSWMPAEAIGWMSLEGLAELDYRIEQAERSSDPVTILAAACQTRTSGAALAGKAADTLQQENAIPCRILYSWEHSSWDCGQDLLHGGTGLVDDEDGMIDARQLARAARHEAKVILFGDPDQLKPIGLGDWMPSEVIGWTNLEGLAELDYHIERAERSSCLVVIHRSRGDVEARQAFASQNTYEGLVGYLLLNQFDTCNEATGFRLPSFPAVRCAAGLRRQGLRSDLSAIVSSKLSAVRARWLLTAARCAALSVVDRCLSDPKLRARSGDMVNKFLVNGRSSPRGGAGLVINEAGLVDSRQLARLMVLQVVYREALLLGDSDRLKTICPGQFWWQRAAGCVAPALDVYEQVTPLSLRLPAPSWRIVN